MSSNGEIASGRERCGGRCHRRLFRRKVRDCRSTAVAGSKKVTMSSLVRIQLVGARFVDLGVRWNKLGKYSCGLARCHTCARCCLAGWMCYTCKWVVVLLLARW